MIIFLKLLLAHLVRDFILSSNLNGKKEKEKVFTYKVCIYALSHFLLIMCLMLDWQFWWWALIISMIHLLSDYGIRYFDNEKNTRMLFFLNQLINVIAIYLLWLVYNNYGINIEFLSSQNIILSITAVLFLTMPVSVIIKVIISKWEPKGNNKERLSLEDAGRYIGIIERVLVFIFVVTDNWEAVGFLLAAKSIFRFGDLKEGNELRFTEYVLIGTLISFGIAILSGMAYKSLYK